MEHLNEKFLQIGLDADGDVVLNFPPLEGYSEGYFATFTGLQARELAKKLNHWADEFDKARAAKNN